MPKTTDNITPTPALEQEAEARKSEMNAADKAVGDIRKELRSSDFYHNLLKPKAKEEKEAKPAHEKQEDAKKEDVPTKPVEPEKPTEPKPPEEKKDTPEISTERIASIAAAAAAKTATEAVMQAAAQRDRNTSAAATPEPTRESLAASLPDEFKEDADVYLEMAQTNPAHASILQELHAYAPMEDAYRTAWEKEHDGEKFDPDSSDHDEWYEKHKPKVTKRDFRQAERALISRQTLAEAEKRVEPRIREMEHTANRQKAEGSLASERTRLLGEVLADIKPEYRSNADSAQSLKKLEETDPIAVDAALEALTKPRVLFENGERKVLAPLSDLMEQTVLIHQGAVDFNIANPVHKELYDGANRTEELLLAAPIQDRMDKNGRLFVGRTEYSRMSKAEQSKHWSIDRDFFLFAIAHQAKIEGARSYKEIVEKTKRWGTVASSKKEDGGENSTKTAEIPSTATNIPASLATLSPQAPTVVGKTTIIQDKGEDNSRSKSWRTTFGLGWK